DKFQNSQMSLMQIRQFSYGKRLAKHNGTNLLYGFTVILQSVICCLKRENYLPSSDLVIAWTFLKGKARDIFIQEMALDEDVWLRAKAWALWKATFELCQIADQNSPEASVQKRIIGDVLYD